MATRSRRYDGWRRRRGLAATVALLAALLAPLAAVQPAAAAPGDITTIAGGGGDGLGDGGPATAARLSFPWGVARSGGNLYVSDNGLSTFGQTPFGNRLRVIDAGGTIHTAVGGVEAPLGDGGPATDAVLSL